MFMNYRNMKFIPLRNFNKFKIKNISKLRKKLLKP